MIELSAVREIAIYDESLVATTVILVQENFGSKTKASPSQTEEGKDKSTPLIPGALEKSIMSKLDSNPLHGKTSKLVIEQPKSSDQSSTSPRTNGAGKDSTNPLNPVALEKSKMTVLGQTTNSFMQDLRPDYLKAAKKDINGAYYVVYTFPSQIVTEWSEAHELCDEK